MTGTDDQRGFPTTVQRFGEVQGFGEMTVDLDPPGRALAIGAHPDDIEIWCGGTLAKWAASGCEVHLLVLTDGSKGTWDHDRDVASLVAARQAEQREAAALLGAAHVIFLGRPDGELCNTAKERWEVARVVRQVRPGVVLGHDPWRRYRLHPDHRNAGFIVTDALVAARDPLYFSDQELAPHRPSALLLFEADVANHVENVAGFEDSKVAALLAHRSQHETTLGITSADEAARIALSADVRRKLAEHGRPAGIGLGESFHRLEV